MCGRSLTFRQAALEIGASPQVGVAQKLFRPFHGGAQPPPHIRRRSRVVAMLIKTDPDEIQSYLSDASHMRDGHADRVVFPESADDVAEILRSASKSKTPVTISGAGTGTVGGRIPLPASFSRPTNSIR